jgi:hypothetical protein
MVFERDGEVYRIVNPVYLPHYRRLMESGLYDALVRSGDLVPHEEVESGGCNDGRKIIKPETIPFISYPYEWCFEQYRDAALLTLRVQRLALQYGMTLKDASSYNAQFRNGRPVFIDTLSFEEFAEGPWPAYGQFCRHFFAPLVLMAFIDVRLGKFMQTYIDGVPLDLAAALLRGKGGFAAWQHISLHAAAVRRFASAGSGANGGPQRGREPAKLKKETLAAIIDSLARSVEALKPREKITEWGDYYRGTNYSEEGAARKAALVDDFLRECAPIRAVWDLGANDGRYSRLALKYGAHITAFDIDPTAVSRNYLAARQAGEPLLPLLLDLAAPSPAIGFSNAERKTITGRGKPEITLALALIHHLVISNNLPLDMTAAYFASFTRFLIIEFVPKEDSQIERLLSTRADIFPDYTEECFEKAFLAHFELLRKKSVADTVRTLYLFRRKSAG